jgi:integrase
MGLGAFPDVALSEARERAAAARKVLRDGLDPLTRRAEQRTGAQTVAITFCDAVAQYVDAYRAGWQSQKATEQWSASLEQHAAFIMKLPVAAIDTDAVRKVLTPIWNCKTETASRVRGRIERVIDYATTRGWRTGENPARWRGHLSNLLPAPSRVSEPQHRPALPWQDVAAFVAALTREGGVGPLALKFTILCGARTGEVIGARWSEVDMQARTWTVPAERMRKTRKPHKVPLSDPAIAVLTELMPLRDPSAGDFIFVGMRRGEHLSSATMLMLAQDKMGHHDITVHGFRSSFRVWVAEATNYPNHVAEMAIAHGIGSRVEAAYRRGDLFDKRVGLMNEWGQFVSAPTLASPRE